MTEDFEGTLVWLLEEPSDTVDSEEDMGAAIKVLASEDCSVFKRERLHRPKAFQVLLEASCEVLDNVRREGRVAGKELPWQPKSGAIHQLSRGVLKF